MYYNIFIVFRTAMESEKLRKDAIAIYIIIRYYNIFIVIYYIYYYICSETLPEEDKFDSNSITVL